MQFHEALHIAKQGEKIRAQEWGPSDPSFLVFVKGREVEASFPPMSDILGKGTKFHSEDHIDAVYVTMAGMDAAEVAYISVTLGYALSMRELADYNWTVI